MNAASPIFPVSKTPCRIAMAALRVDVVKAAADDDEGGGSHSVGTPPLLPLCCSWGPRRRRTIWAEAVPPVHIS